jgi:hypothetical protein
LVLPEDQGALLQAKPVRVLDKITAEMPEFDKEGRFITSFWRNSPLDYHFAL